MEGRRVRSSLVVFSGGEIERRGTLGFQLTGLPSRTADLSRSPLPAWRSRSSFSPRGSRLGIDRHVCLANVNSGTCAPVEVRKISTRSFLPCFFFPQCILIPGLLPSPGFVSRDSPSFLDVGSFSFAFFLNFEDDIPITGRVSVATFDLNSRCEINSSTR